MWYIFDTAIPNIFQNILPKHWNNCHNVAMLSQSYVSLHILALEWYLNAQHVDISVQMLNILWLWLFVRLCRSDNTEYIEWMGVCSFYRCTYNDILSKHVASAHLKPDSNSTDCKDQELMELIYMETCLFPSTFKALLQSPISVCTDISNMSSK